MSAAAYETLQKLTETGRLEIIHLVAPPRSSSTALERALSNSPDVTAQINDPWSLYDADREAQTYDYILSRVAAVLPTEGLARVVIKDIADYIPPGSAWDAMTALVKHTIFLVREPLLAMESMMQIMAREIPEAEGEAYARSAGYDSWKVMQQAVSVERDYRPYEALYKDLFRKEQPIQQLPEMQVPVLVTTPITFIRRLGFASYDAYAVAKGFASWDALRDALLGGKAAPDVASDLLDENFRCRITGWTALWQHFSRMDDNASIDVVDATMFRALPASFLPGIFKQADLRFSTQVIDWKSSDKAFNPDYEGEVPYYDKVVQSAGIEPPTETPVPPDHFPQFIQESLVGDEGALQIYERFVHHIMSRMPQERRQALVEATVNGTPLRDIDPVFYDLITKNEKE
ncbi:MAG TPA: hypothetical protein VLH84_00865 [Patescibacteria group bacterium]|nr:hypothetical protein [Patescibacteria group bacterium]